MDHHQQLGQFSIFCYHSTVSRRPLECVFCCESSCQRNACDTLTAAITQTARRPAGLAGRAKEQRRGACELSEGSGGPGQRAQNWVNRRGEGGGAGAQLSPWQLRCWRSYYLLISGKYAAIRKRRFILSVQRRPRVRATHFHLLEAVPWRRLSDRRREGAEMLKACAVLLSVPGVPKLFHVPLKNSIGFWPGSPFAKQTMLRYMERNFYVQNLFLSFSFFLTFIWYSIIATLV